MSPLKSQTDPLEILKRRVGAENGANTHDLLHGFHCHRPPFVRALPSSDRFRVGWRDTRQEDVEMSPTQSRISPSIQRILRLFVRALPWRFDLLPNLWQTARAPPSRNHSLCLRNSRSLSPSASLSLSLPLSFQSPLVRPLSHPGDNPGANRWLF